MFNLQPITWTRRMCLLLTDEKTKNKEKEAWDRPLKKYILICLLFTEYFDFFSINHGSSEHISTNYALVQSTDIYLSKHMTYWIPRTLLYCLPPLLAVVTYPVITKTTGRLSDGDFFLFSASYTCGIKVVEYFSRTLSELN